MWTLNYGPRPAFQSWASNRCNFCALETEWITYSAINSHASQHPKSHCVCSALTIKAAGPLNRSFVSLCGRKKKLTKCWTLTVLESRTAWSVFFQTQKQKEPDKVRWFYMSWMLYTVCRSYHALLMQLLQQAEIWSVLVSIRRFVKECFCQGSGQRGLWWSGHVARQLLRAHDKTLPSRSEVLRSLCLLHL